MTQIFDPLWIIYLPSLFIAIFVIISVIFALIKIKFDKTKISIFSTSITGLIFSVVNICVACISISLGFFSIFFNLPLILVGFLFGMSAISISNIIIEKWQKDFPFKEFIITTLMITLSLTLLYLIYLIPNVMAEPHGYFTPESENIHIHSDLKIFGNDEEINLYTEENMEKNSFFHFHDGKSQENVIHFEGKRGTLADFLETINTFSLEDCIKKQYEKKENLYSFWVNGQPSDLDYGEYVVNDLDKILFKCGSEPPTQEQINSVGNFACIQSKKC